MDVADTAYLMHVCTPSTLRLPYADP